MSMGETVFLHPGTLPEDYHCRCDYCRKAIGELRPEGGGYYSRLERREYYDPSEQGKEGHVAKTPLHIGRWAVQQYTVPGDWVLDPTIGAGTTAVEALTQGRNVAGMELQYGKILEANVKRALALVQKPVTSRLASGDARNIGPFLDDLGVQFKLVVNNPPYSGDEGDGGIGADHPLKKALRYKSDLPNLAFLKEGSRYWDALATIYQACIDRMETGGYFVVGVKDMMRNKEPFLLHAKISDMLSGELGLDFVGTAFLKHHPGTLHLNTYEKRYGVKPPLYQTINVFKKS